MRQGGRLQSTRKLPIRALVLCCLAGLVLVAFAEFLFAARQDEKLGTVVVRGENLSLVPDDQGAARRQAAAKVDNLLGDFSTTIRSIVVADDSGCQL